MAEKATKLRGVVFGESYPGFVMTFAAIFLGGLLALFGDDRKEAMMGVVVRDPFGGFVGSCPENRHDYGGYPEQNPVTFFDCHSYLIGKSRRS
jgi:hypothetical protein